MRIGKFLSTLVLLIPLIIVSNCNDDLTDRSVLQPTLLSGDQVIQPSFKVFKKIDYNDPRDITENPQNYVEVTPVLWDGVSPLEKNVVYWGNKDLSEKLFERFPDLRKPVENHRMGIRNGNSKEKTSGDSKLATAWELDATAICGSHGVGWAWAQASGYYGSAVVNAYVEAGEQWFFDYDSGSGGTYILAYVSLLADSGILAVASYQGEPYWDQVSHSC